MSRNKPPDQLFLPKDTLRFLAQAKSLKEVTDLRLQAETARKYAQCAKLSLEKQNQCAAIKLQCERKAGQLLMDLGVNRGRPGKRKKSHDGTFLKRLGINKNQSSRWQQEAKVPEELFQLYLAMARDEGKEPTSRGLLQLARQLPCANERSSATCSSERPIPERRRRGAEAIPHPPLRAKELAPSVADKAIDLITELLNHHGLFSDNLTEFCEQEVVRPILIQRRTVARLLCESKNLLMELSRILKLAVP